MDVIRFLQYRTGPVQHDGDLQEEPDPRRGSVWPVLIQVNVAMRPRIARFSTPGSSPAVLTLAIQSVNTPIHNVLSKPWMLDSISRKTNERR
jgi:hypothetical protein